MRRDIDLALSGETGHLGRQVIPVLFRALVDGFGQTIKRLQASDRRTPLPTGQLCETGGGCKRWIDEIHIRNRGLPWSR